MLLVFFYPIIWTAGTVHVVARFLIRLGSVPCLHREVGTFLPHELPHCHPQPDITASATAVMATALEAVFNHVALPPRLPGQQDDDIENIESNLVARMLKAVEPVIDLPGNATSSIPENALNCPRRSLEICKTIHLQHTTWRWHHSTRHRAERRTPHPTWYEVSDTKILLRLLETD